MNRKLTASVLCCVMLALAACGGKSDKEAENAAENATAAAEETAEVETYTPAVHEEGKYYVGIIQQAGHEALNDASRGFQDELNELMGDEVVIDCQVADGTEMGCDIIVDHFLQDQDDLISLREARWHSDRPMPRPRTFRSWEWALRITSLRAA